MINKILASLLIILSFYIQPVFALEHASKNGLLRMDIPATWHWVEYPQEIVITYPDGKTAAMDIQMVPSTLLGDTATRNAIKAGDDQMMQKIKDHQGIFLDEKVLDLDGVYATQLDFKTASPQVRVAFISLFTKGYAVSMTYGTQDEKMREMMDDAVASLKFK